MRSLCLVLGVAAAFATPTLAASQAAPADSTRRVFPTAMRTGAGPDGATLRCRDGSYPRPFAPDAECEGKGGVLVRFPVRSVPALPNASPFAVQADPFAHGSIAVADSSPPPGFAPFVSRAGDREPAFRVPAGATFLCANGTFVVRDTASVRCAAHGGVSIQFQPGDPAGGPAGAAPAPATRTTPPTPTTRTVPGEPRTP